MAQNLQAAVLLELEQATGALLSELFSKQNSTASVASSPVGTMAALKLPDLSGVNDSFIPAILEDSPAAAILPAEALELAPGAVLVMTTFNEGTGSANPLGSGISASGSDGKSLASVVDAVDISLVDIGDGASRKVMVTTPIYVRLSDVAPATTTPLLCAFLDGDVWSQQGIRVATEEELNDFFGGQVNTTGLWCATTHLSIFSAFVDLLLDCTNVNVLSQDGLEEIFRNRWWFRLPALLLWLLLAALLVLLVVGVRQDRKLYSLGMWSDECFLTELPPVARRCSLSAAFSRWREQQQTMPMFSTEKSMESIAYLNEAFNDWMKKNHLQPRLSDKLQETILCQNTLREVALQHQVHPSFMVGHIWGPEGWVQGSLAMTKSKKLKSLQVELEEGLPQAFLKAHSSRMHRACSACVAAHPVCELWQWDLHITSAKRAKIIADCILGSLAFVALFFSVDGTAVAARSPENCPVQQGTFLWYTFVAIVSILLNLIPRGLIMYIAYRGFVQESTMHRKWQLRLLHFKDACFWTLGVLVSSIQLLVIIAFLANLSEVDEWKWLISFAVVLVRKMLLVPLLACLFASLGTEIAAWSQPSIVSQPPKKLGLDMDLLEGKAVLEMEEEGELTETWTQKVEELAQRGITIRQLLDFYASLGTLMPHFDPDRSTTHDVVRQAIIPNSLHYRNWRTFMVVVHQASDLAAMDFFNSDPYCIVRCVSSMPKPWKGGGESATIKQTRHPKWEEAFLLYEVVQDESLHLSVWDQDVLSKDDALGEVSLAASDFWDGFDGTLPLQGPGTSAGSSPVLQITVTSYLQRSAAVDALEAFQVARRTRSKSHLRGWAGTRVFESEAGTAARESTEDEYCDTGDHVPIVINKDKLHDRSRCAIAASKGVFSRSLEAVDGESSSQWCCRDTPGLDEDLRNVGICILEEPAEERTERMEAIADQPEPLPGYAYASCVNMGQPQLGQKMVTHSWRNKFSFLLAAIIADALDLQLYDSVMQLLKDQKFEELCEALNRRMKLDVAYWVCAFSVNQHAGICASPDARDSTGHSIQPYSCCTAKHFQGDLSEMNKFDHMMALLKFRLRQDFSEVRLEQVVAMEPDFSLLTRIWCIAELVEAKKLHLPQAIMIHSAASRTDCLKRLFELDVRDANASFPADKELILNKIPEVDAFNRQLKDLILHRLDHFLETNGSRLAATIVDELVLAFFTIAF